MNKPRIYGLDFLRVICSLSVCIYHITSWDQYADFTAVGYYGVCVFFITKYIENTCIKYMRKKINGQ